MSDPLLILSALDFEGRIADLRLHLPSRASSSHGRVLVLAQVNGEELDIEIHSSLLPSSETLIASASGGIGTLTLTAENDFGVRGSLEVLAIEEANGLAFTNFAFSEDLQRLEQGLDALLDGEGETAGMLGFDSFLEMARDEVLAILESRFARDADLNWLSWPLCFAIENSEALTECVASMALTRLHQWHGEQPTPYADAKGHGLYLQALVALDRARLTIRLSPESPNTFTLTLNRRRVMRG